MTGPRLLVFLNGLTAIACALHVLVHAAGLGIGEWHDYAVYALVAASLAASVSYFRKVERQGSGSVANAEQLSPS